MLCGDAWGGMIGVGSVVGVVGVVGVSPIITMRKTKPHQGGHIAKKVMWGVIII